MKPTRRVLLFITVLVLVMLGAMFTTWHVQTRALGDALAADVEATLARTIERDPPLEAPRHDNGYACLDGVLQVTPKDLGPFETKNSKDFSQALDAGVVPEEWKEKAVELAPWAASMRSCGDSAQLKFAAGVTPFSDAAPHGERAGQVMLALERLTRLQVQLLGAEGNQEAAEHCAGTLEVTVDYSHLNLIAAMITSGAVRKLTPPCAEALQRLSPEARAALARRYARLPSRLAHNHEYMDAERQVMSLSAYGWLMTAEQRAKVPPIGFSLVDGLQNPVARFVLARTWPRYDKAMRQFVAVVDVPGPARSEATEALEASFQRWWLPEALSATPSYEKFLQRHEDTQVLLQLLAALADGSTLLPARVSRSSEGLEFTDFKGEQLIIPAP